MNDIATQEYGSDATSPASASIVHENSVTQRFLDVARGRGRSLAAQTAEYEFLMRDYVNGLRAFNRPVLLDEAMVRDLEKDLDEFVSLMYSLPQRLYDGELRAMMRDLGVPERQLAAMTALSGDRTPVRLGRADLYREQSGFKLLEYNASCSLGGWDIEKLTLAYLRDPGFAEFAEREGLVCPPTLRLIMDTMLQEVGPLDTADRPMIALADWPHTLKNIRPVLRVVSGLLDGLGYRASPCHLGELDHRSDGVYLHGEKVDVVFRLFLPKGLMTGGDEAYRLLDLLHESVRGGRVRYFADLGLDLFCHKGCLALLSDERDAHAFDATERALIDRLLPWTRILRDRRTEADGETVDLVAYVKAHREDLIIKPAYDYGGAGIAAGWKVGDEEWSKLVDGSLSGSHLVQRRSRPVMERFLDDDSGELRPWVLNWGVFVTPFGYGGTSVRGIPDPDVSVVSVGAGAFKGGAFHVEPGRTDAGPQARSAS